MKKLGYDTSIRSYIRSVFILFFIFLRQLSDTVCLMWIQYFCTFTNTIKVSTYTAQCAKIFDIIKKQICTFFGF